MCRNHWQIIYNCFPHILKFFFQVYLIIHHFFQYDFIFASPKISKLCAHFIFVSLWLSPLLTPDFKIPVCPPLLLFHYNFVILLIKKNLFFPLVISALSKWLLTFFSVSETGQDTRGKTVPFSEKPKPRGERRKTSPQIKWFEVYHAMCHTHGDTSPGPPPFLFSLVSLWSATAR